MVIPSAIEVRQTAVMITEETNIAFKNVSLFTLVLILAVLKL